MGAATRKGLYQPDPPGQQFLHHTLLQGEGLVAARFEGGELGVPIRHHLGDGDMVGFS